MMEGTHAITITLPIQKPGAPDSLLRTRSAPLGMRVMRRRASFISAPVRARIDVDRHSKRLGHAVSGYVVIGRPNAASGEDIGVAMPERIDRVNDRRLFVADYPHFQEIHAERGQIFRDITDILVLGAARQDLVADHQKSGRDGLFGSGRENEARRQVTYARMHGLLASVTEPA
jgi:hypothetical protein